MAIATLGKAPTGAKILQGLKRIELWSIYAHTLCRTIVEQVKDLPGDLTLEQQFQLRMITLQVRELGLKQAQEYVVEITRQMMVKDNLVKHLLKSA